MPQGAAPSMLGEAFPCLELYFLGGVKVIWGSTVLPVGPRLAEICAVLAMHPSGLTGEQLTLAVYGDSGSPTACKTALSRLHTLVPLYNRPYRLVAPVQADFLQIEVLLSAGCIHEALGLYCGPLLPLSEAPEIVETRLYLEVALRRAVLTGRDAEAHWMLAHALRDDLEVWEATLRCLPLGDPRRSLGETRIILLSRQ